MVYDFGRFGEQTNGFNQAVRILDGKITTLGKLCSPVLESMRAREPGLRATRNLAGSKIKNTQFFSLY